MRQFESTVCSLVWLWTVLVWSGPAVLGGEYDVTRDSRWD